jgi:hypothetical protein
VTRLLLTLLSSMFIAAAPASLESVSDLRFFAGSTEAASVTKVMLQKPFTTRWVGRGKINADGSLVLTQHVTEEGRREFDRRWQIHQVGPGRFTGTMSEASGPVSVDKIGNRYRFRFTMKGNLSVEQWITPHSDQTSADTQSTIRRLGISVAHATGWIRKTDSVQLRIAGPRARTSS